MNDDLQAARLNRSAHESSVVNARLALERSKNETAALNRNLRQFDATTRKRKLRNYALIGAGSFAVGALLSTVAFQSLGMLTFPEISFQQPTSKAKVTAPVPAQATVPTASSTTASPPTPPIAAKEDAIKIVVSATGVAAQPVAAAPIVVDVKKSVFQASPAKPQAAPAVKPKTDSPIQITPNAQAKPVTITATKDAGSSDELGFKPASNYTIVSIPADGVLMIKKNGETTQQMVRVGGKLPDGEELRAAKSGTKEIETNSRKFIFSQ